jgi:hypothetical protein
MRIGATSWMLLAGAAICVGAGCGGSLSGGTGGTGGGAAGAPGTSGTAATSGIAATNGTAGTSSTAGSAGGDDAGAGGSAYNGVTTWGDVTVEIGPTNLAPGNLSMHVIDPTNLDSGRAFIYPASTKLYPNDGAYIAVRYGCATTAVDQVAVSSCAADGFAGGTATPGCIGVTFDQRGPMGNFVDTDGTSCDVTTGSASFHIPPPDVPNPAQAGPTPDVASGSFTLDCVRPYGTHLSLTARFVIPVETRVLLCIN